MKWFHRRARQSQSSELIPQLKSPFAHLIGPGKLRVKDNNLVFRSTRATQVALNLEDLKFILAYGNVNPSAMALARVAQHGIYLSFLSQNGFKLRAVMAPFNSTRVIQRVLQIRVLDGIHHRLAFAKKCVIDKINSQKSAIRHYQRQGREISGGHLKTLAEYSRRAECATTIDQVRGFEGAATAVWYEAFGSVLRKPWIFKKRSRRPPADPVNAMLGFGYALLYQRITAQIQAVGLEPAVGYLHCFRAGRMSLTCDIMESFRVPMVDRLIIRLCNQGRVRQDWFSNLGDGRIQLSKKQLPWFIGIWQEHWHEGRFEHLLERHVSQFISELRKRVPSGPQLQRAIRSGNL